MEHPTFKLTTISKFNDRPSSKTFPSYDKALAVYQDCVRDPAFYDVIMLVAMNQHDMGMTRVLKAWTSVRVKDAL